MRHRFTYSKTIMISLLDSIFMHFEYVSGFGRWPEIYRYKGFKNMTGPDRI